MKKLRPGLLALFALMPLSAVADVSVGDLPDNTVWYFHADLEAMRTGDAGSQVYAWFDEEVGDEVREEVGIDISEEVDTVTAFSNNVDGTIIVVDGPMSKATRDKILALAAQEGPVDPREHDGETYYFFGDEDDIDDNGDEPFEDESFDLKFTHPGLLAMAGSPPMRDKESEELTHVPNNNTSQFFITTSAAPHHDGRHVVFGRVLSGMEVVRRIEACPTVGERPREPIVISDCGEVLD